MKLQCWLLSVVVFAASVSAPVAVAPVAIGASLAVAESDVLLLL